MLLGRLLDEKFASLYRGGKIHGGVFLGRGQEALSVAFAMQLRDDDVYAPLIRDGAGRLAFGEPIVDAVRTYLGSPLGPMRSRDGNVHRGDPRRGYVPMISHLGATVPVVNGMLMARRFQGRDGCVGVASMGDGATSTGAFHEAANQAGVEKLPLVLVVANNQFAYSTPTDRQFACENLVERAVGYGMKGHTLDATDLEACLQVASQSVEAARGGGGPQLIVAELLRLCGHGEHDDASYISEEMKSAPAGRDCLAGSRKLLLDRGFATEDELAAWAKEAKGEIDETVSMVQREGNPDPFSEDWQSLASKHLSDVYCNT